MMDSKTRMDLVKNYRTNKVEATQDDVAVMIKQMRDRRAVKQSQPVKETVKKQDKKQSKTNKSHRYRPTVYRPTVEYRPIVDTSGFGKLYDLGYDDVAIGDLCRVSPPTVAKWRRLTGRGVQKIQCPDDRICELYEMGYTDVVIAHALEISPIVVTWWRKTNGKTANWHSHDNAVSVTFAKLKKYKTQNVINISPELKRALGWASDDTLCMCIVADGVLQILKT